MTEASPAVHRIAPTVAGGPAPPTRRGRVLPEHREAASPSLDCLPVGKPFTGSSVLAPEKESLTGGKPSQQQSAGIA